MPYPKVKYATSDNLLYPLEAINGTKVTVAFEGMCKRHRIQLHWDGPSGPGSPTLPIVDGRDIGSVVIPIDASVIGACVGKTVSVWYTATLGDQTQESYKLELTVETIEPEDLPTPEFCDLKFEDGDWWLNMRWFDGNARIALPVWPFIAAGQRLWILAVGNEHQEDNYRFSWVLENHVVTTQEAEPERKLELKLSRTWLAGCEDYSSVTLNVAVTFDGALGTRPVDPSVSLLPANAHELLHTTAKLRVTEIEEFDDFENYPKKEYLGPGSTIDTRLLKFVLPQDSPKGIGLHVVRTPPEDFPEMLQGKALALCCGGVPEQLRLARLLLKWKCSRIKFAYATTGEGATFRFIGDGDLLLEERWVESRTWVNFQDLQGRLLHCIEVESLQHGSIDNLTIWHKGEPNPV
ncbi:hypothetical protein PS900_05629 [Pseudomonas fluorescens]|uniref:Uncharacterized protein n=1 Tax=Pseudomonas fluorescens TaxID=294 RepID=A0A8H2NZ89_PSEFL|nr:hypothetical protein [Pseudomonas fluorescens]VVP54727.1 hypothetical protein PS900_05629 [Pseudomonas fluorescens]